MKTYKGLLCSMLATRMLLGQETPLIQTQPQASEAQSSQEAVIEYEKQLIANAMTGADSPAAAPLSTAQASEAEAAVDSTEAADASSETDASTFASAQKLFNEMWGVKDSAKEKKPKAPTVISTKESNPSISSAQIATTLPPNNLIPFVQEKTYAQNPVAGSDVKLPPMPDTLLPMGKPKLVAVSPKPKIKPEMISGENSPHEKSEKEAAAKAAEVAENKSHQTSPADEPQVAVSPFVQWIRENQKSPEIAKEVSEQFKTNETQKDSTRPEDVFLKIRFPYTGSQASPPAGGAVIYSTPQK